MNGQTGKVSGVLPISYTRLGLATLGIFAGLLALFLLGGYFLWKRLLPIFFLILLAFGLALPVSAAENSIDDDAQLLTPDQINQLKQEIQPLEEKTKASVFIVTTNNNTYGDEQEFADHYLLNKVGKDQNAILFLIDMDLRKVYISTSGNMIDYMTDARIDDTLDKVMDGMSQGNYFAAAQTFVQETQAFVDKGVIGVTIVWTAKQVKSPVIKPLARWKW